MFISAFARVFNPLVDTGFPIRTCATERGPATSAGPCAESWAEALRTRRSGADSRADMTQQQLLDEGARAPVDRARVSRGGGSVGLVLLIALLLVGAAAGFMYLGPARAEPFILPLLAVLAMIGVFLLFSLAAGILRTSGRDQAS